MLMAVQGANLTLWVKYQAQGHISMWTVGAEARTSDLPITEHQVKLRPPPQKEQEDELPLGEGVEHPYGGRHKGLESFFDSPGSVVSNTRGQETIFSI